MGIVIDEVIAEVQPEPQGGEGHAPPLSARQPRTDVAADLRRLAARAARVQAD